VRSRRVASVEEYMMVRLPTARMIMEERLKGSIDQVARVIHFETTSDERDALAQWDGRIRRACATVSTRLRDVLTCARAVG
jgi:hypothetical protein